MAYFKEAQNTGLLKGKATGLEQKAQEDEDNAASYCN